MSRGDFRWLFTFTDAVELNRGGVMPAFIEWEGEHPASRLPDYGFELARFEGVDPAADVTREDLALFGLDRVLRLTEGEAPSLRATIRTPQGERVLD